MMLSPVIGMAIKFLFLQNKSLTMTNGGLQKCMAAVLISALLASCSVTRHTVPSSEEELTRLVLVIKETPDGQVTHEWRRATDFEFEHGGQRPITENTSGRIVLAAGQQTDCYSQYLECYQQCRQTPIPQDFNQYLHDFGPRAGHDRYCSEKCMPQYTNCLKSQARPVQEFTAEERAIDWLKHNRESVLVGSLVVIAGVVFVTVSAGAGVIILAPLAVVASSEVPGAPYFAAVSP
jgi:hypothetical protein